MFRGPIIAIAVAFCTALLMPKAASAQSIVGTIPGAFAVSNGGSATYSIPVRIAPGTAGAQPLLTLQYDSQRADASAGLGWALTGVSTIAREPRTLYDDGVVDGVRLADSDILSLDGQRLVQVSVAGTGAARVVEYRKQTDDLTRVREFGADLSHARFVVSTKGGVTEIFDGSNNSDITLADGTILLFAVSRVLDSSGNYSDYTYTQNGLGDFNVSRIDYSGNVGGHAPIARVDFTYDTAPSARSYFIAGRMIRKDLRLTGIVSHAANLPQDDPAVQWRTVAAYSFDYEAQAGSSNFVLTGVHEALGDDAKTLVATKFTYSKPSVGWAAAGYTLNLPAAATAQQLAAGYRYAHVAPGSGALPDILFSELVQGKLESWALKNDGGTWSTLTGLQPLIPFAADDGSDLGVMLLDVNGDGRVDLLQSYSRDGQPDQRSAFLAGSSQWDSTPSYGLPFVLSRNGKAIAHS